MMAYFDCFSGISGDMTLGALIDLGVPLPWLKEAIAALPLSGFDITAADVEYNGIKAKRVEVHAHGEHHHRHYSDIRTLIEKSPLPEQVRGTALSIFRRLAEAEAGVHGCTPEEVHFHEVGAVDAIVDVVGSALGLHRLGVTEAAASAIPNGRGFVVCRHGRLPIPAPATVAILKGIPTYGADADYELTTPTGAAIVSTVAKKFGPMPLLAAAGIGYGAGHRNLEPGPNLLRVVIGEAAEIPSDNGNNFKQDLIVVVESSIDDMNPEIFGFLMDRLFEEGALDVAWIPIQMKKNRPGTLLQALCRKEKLGDVARCILSESSSLGVRYHEVSRYILERDNVTIDSSFGPISMKRVSYPQGEVRLVPEFDVCRLIALERGLPLRTVYDTIIRDACERKITGKQGDVA
jgi:pyridinium-3,5-bisthiocarboxylic acid mononucleotide nickel chelatase